MKLRYALLLSIMLLITVSIVLGINQNYGVYDYDTDTMHIYDSSNNLTCKATLKSEHHELVGWGEEILVAQYDIEITNEMDGSDVFGIVETYDLRRGNSQIQKNFVYKEQKPEEVEVVERFCEPTGETHGNGTIVMNCTNQLVEKQVLEWKSFNKNSPSLQGNYTIGLFTEVEQNERVEWIPEICDVRIPQWAVWENSLNTDLVVYWTLNETSGHAIDSVLGDNNLTDFGGGVVRGREGANASVTNGSYYFGGGATAYISTQLVGELGNATEGSISMLVNFTALVLPNTEYVLWSLSNWSSTNVNHMFLNLNGDNAVRELELDVYQDGSQAYKYSTNSDWLDNGIPRNNWTHIVLRHNGTAVNLTVNNISVPFIRVTNGVSNSTWFKQLIERGSIHFNLAARFQSSVYDKNYLGMIDEVAIWNRSITDEEIENLYNNRSFLTYQDFDTTVPNLKVVIPSINNTNTTDNQLSVNFTAIDEKEIQTCWWSNNSGISNTTLTCGLNITGQTWLERENNLTIWANDSSGNLNITSITFFVDTTNPNLTIISPNTTFSTQTNILVNISAWDLNGLGNCTYNVTKGAATEISDTPIPNCINTTLDVSGDGNYVIAVFVNDTLGLSNVSTASFTVSTATPPGPGGGGGSTIIIIGEDATTWTMQARGGGVKYEIPMVAGSSRSKDIEFENNGTSSRTIAMSCEDVEGTLCNYVSYSDDSFNLPLAQDVKTIVSFQIDLPESIENGVYIFNTVATDDLNRVGRLTVEVSVGRVGFLSEIGVRLSSSKTLFGYNIPYVLILLLIVSVLSVILAFIGLRKIRGGIGISILISLIVGIISILLI